MRKTKEKYKNLVDSLVEMSKKCVYANRVKKGKIGETEKDTVINKILDKLSVEEKTELARYISESYEGGVYDTLFMLQEKEVDFIFDGDPLEIAILEGISGEGISGDYIGRKNNWNWLE